MTKLVPKQFFSSPKNIVTICHLSPDGDAIGSSMAVYHLMKAMGHTVQVIVPNDYPSFLKYLDGINNVLNYSNSKEEAKEKIQSADAIFNLDYNDPKRVGEMSDLIMNATAYKLLIDHHLQPVDFTDYSLSDTSASSTCELVYRFAEEQGYLSHINSAFANAVYMGILTDTGKFSFNITKNVHHVVGEMIEAGADVEQANLEIFNSYSLGRMRFWGFCLSKRMRVHKKEGVSIMPLSIEDMHRFNVQKGDTEGLVNQPLAIKGINISILLKEEGDKIKLSLRSKGDVSVNDIAREHFNGGGHKNASGGKLEIPFKEAIKKVESVLNLQNTNNH